MEKYDVELKAAIWGRISPEKEIVSTYLYRFDDYQAALLIQIPEGSQSEGSGPKYIFPLSRVRNIMKQDSFYSAKVEATAAMSKAT